MARSLRNEVLSDRELLHLINDIADQDPRGHVQADDVVDSLKFNQNGDRSAVTSRMAWMARFGFLSRIEPRELGLPATAKTRYVITPEGRALMGGRINATMQKALEKADAGTGLLILREVAERSYVNGSQTAANGLRRQWQHTAAKRGR